MIFLFLLIFPFLNFSIFKTMVSFGCAELFIWIFELKDIRIVGFLIGEYRALDAPTLSIWLHTLMNSDIINRERMCCEHEKILNTLAHCVHSLPQIVTISSKSKNNYIQQFTPHDWPINQWTSNLNFSQWEKRIV